MLLALLAALVLGGPPASDWPATAEKLKSVAENYKSWGVSFRLDGDSEFGSLNTPIPQHTDITGSIQTPDSLTLDVQANIGEKQALAVHLSAAFKLDAQRNAVEGSGALYAEGRGLIGKFKYDRFTGVVCDAGIEQTLYALGIKLGEGESGPAELGLKLGALCIDIDPTTWARKYVEMAPTLTKSGAEKIGGVSIEADTDALVSAVTDSPIPPLKYLTSRLAVSIKAALAAGAKDIGSLNSVEGVLVDAAHGDLILVGRHDADIPPIPMEMVASLARAVYVQGRHPWVTIDPQAGNFAAPYRARVGGVGPELEKSLLIDIMLTADYAMKQLVMGSHKTEGVPDMMELTGDPEPAQPAQWRCWITPAPPAPGSIRISAVTGGRYYHYAVQPLIRVEAEQNTDAGPSGVETLLSSLKSGEPTAAVRAKRIALSYSQNYTMVERSWPDSSFGRARQVLQLSGIFSLLKLNEKDPWQAVLMASLAGLQVSKRDIRTSFPGLQSRAVPFGDGVLSVEGGMNTDVGLPAPATGYEKLSRDSIHWNAWHGTLAPPEPAVYDPRSISPLAGADEALRDGLRALSGNEYEAAVASARVALGLRPQWDDAEALLVSALNSTQNAQAFAELDQAMKTTPSSWKLLTMKALLQGAQGSWSDLQNTATQLIALRPQMAQAYALRARGLYRSGVTTCLQDWYTAIRMAPESSDYRLGRAAFYVWQKQDVLALADIDAAIKISPLQSQNYLVKGELLLRLNRNSEAAAALKSAVKLAPTDSLTNDILGRALFLTGDFEGAVESMTVAFLTRPRDPAFQLSDQPAAHDPGPPIRFREPTDPLEQFVDSPDQPHKQISAETAVFDPIIWLVRGISQFNLEHYQEAQQDLTRYDALTVGYKRAAEARISPDKPVDVKKLLEVCAEKLQ